VNNELGLRDWGAGRRAGLKGSRGNIRSAQLEKGMEGSICAWALQ
jgi:hypothetical protein